MTRDDILHLSAADMQALLDGELPAEEARHVLEHAASCARCQADIEAWRMLFSELEELPALVPSEDFAQRVIDALPGRVPLVVRLRTWIGGQVRPPGRETPHLGPEVLQDFVDGLLPARDAGRVEAHLAACARCEGDAAAWRGLFGELEGLTRFAPSDGFAGRVLAGVRLPTPAPAALRAPLRERASRWVAGLVPRRPGAWVPAWARSLVPRTRRAWALVTAVAAMPSVALTVALVALFSHPMLTPGYLASYLWWKVSGAVAALAATAWATVAPGLEVVRTTSLVSAVVGSLAGLVTAGLVLSALMAASLWILYRNLVVTPTVKARYARISL